MEMKLSSSECSQPRFASVMKKSDDKHLLTTEICK